MSIVRGSLIEEMQRLAANGHNIGVVIVDEQIEEVGPVSDITRAQQAVILFARDMNHPMWVVELNPNPAANPNTPTNSRLTRHLPPGTPVVTKPFLNAFIGTNLHALLQASNIDTFVLMGYATNCCVARTAVGGFTRPSHRVAQAGASQLGYLVLTCQQVLRGGNAAWKMEPGVRFLSDL